MYYENLENQLSEFGKIRLWIFEKLNKHIPIYWKRPNHSKRFGDKLYDALIEQNGIYLDGQTALNRVKNNQAALKRLALRKRGGYGPINFVNEAAQTEPLQANRESSLPDAVGHLMILS